MIFIRWHRFATEIVLQSIESTFLKLMQSLRSASLPATHFSDSISVTTNILNATANIEEAVSVPVNKGRWNWKAVVVDDAADS